MDEFIHKASTAFTLALEAVNSIPASSWYVFGGLLGFGITSSVVIAVVSYRRQYKGLDKLAKQTTIYLLNLLSALSAIGVFIVSGSAGFLPFFGAAYPTVLAIAINFNNFVGSKLYKQIATKLGTWANNRNEPKQSIFTTKLTSPSNEPEQPVEKKKPEGTGLFD